MYCPLVCRRLESTNLGVTETMPNQFFLKNFGLLMLAVGFTSIPGSAQAGFEWVAPAVPSNLNPSSSGIMSPNESVVVPQAMGRPEIIRPTIISPRAESSSHVVGGASSEPIIIGGDAQTMTSSSVPMPQHVMPDDILVPMSPPPAPRAMPDDIIIPPASATSSMPSAATMSGSSYIVLGFAKNVPLAVALRQILPPGYGFSIDSSVDMGVLVSFQGGKPWRDTLRTALGPAGLVMREQGQMVNIGYPAGGPLPAHAMPLPMAADMAPMPMSMADDTAGNVVVTKPNTVVHEHFLRLPPSALAPAMPEPMPSVVVSGIAPAPLAGSGGAPEAWEADRGDGLRKVMERWAHRANVELNWMSEYDYPLQASVRFTGTFEDAVRSLLTGFEGAHPQPVAELHSNSKIGETVMVVTTRGNAGE